MGDGGARLLAKALQINTKLKSIVYDRNNITVQGFSDIAYALERCVFVILCEILQCNFTMHYSPILHLKSKNPFIYAETVQ